MRLTAQQVYDKLINDDRILEIEGRITFDFGDVNITVKQKDVVGNIIQDRIIFRPCLNASFSIVQKTLTTPNAKIAQTQNFCQQKLSFPLHFYT